MKKKSPAAGPAAAPAETSAPAPQPPETAKSAKAGGVPQTEAEPKPVESAPRKTTAEILREALAAKQSGTAPGGVRLRPQMEGGRVAKDAERRSGKSRKVH